MERIETMDSLRAVRIDLDDMLQTAGATGLQLGQYMRISSLVLDASDSVAAGAPAPDLRLFLAAEVTRDSLDLPSLAGILWRRIVLEYPESPYAAKAWLALGALDRSGADSSLAVLTERYPDSPYYLAAQGQDAPGFVALEDSLFRFAIAMRRAARPLTPGRQPAPSSSNRLPEN
jgi:hypothetical protein